MYNLVHTLLNTILSTYQIIVLRSKKFAVIPKFGCFGLPIALRILHNCWRGWGTSIFLDKSFFGNFFLVLAFRFFFTSFQVKLINGCLQRNKEKEIKLRLVHDNICKRTNLLSDLLKILVMRKVAQNKNYSFWVTILWRSKAKKFWPLSINIIVPFFNSLSLSLSLSHPHSGDRQCRH